MGEVGVGQDVRHEGEVRQVGEVEGEGTKY